jgi:hypothetical protein
MSKIRKWINPWFLVCWIASEICTYMAGRWFTRGHPHWDCKAGKPFAWSVKKYGDRPQEFFYQKWESRRQFWLKKMNVQLMTFEAAERARVRRKIEVQA